MYREVIGEKGSRISVAVSPVQNNILLQVECENPVNSGKHKYSLAELTVDQAEAVIAYLQEAIKDKSATKREVNKMVIENAVIESTFLGFEGHGILTFVLGLQGKGWGVGFGNIALDQWSDEEQRRVAHHKSMECIAKILEVVGVDRWEDLNGKYVRIASHEGSEGQSRIGLGSTITHIGNIVENRWLDLDEMFGEGA